MKASKNIFLIWGGILIGAGIVELILIKQIVTLFTILCGILLIIINWKENKGEVKE